MSWSPDDTPDKTGTDAGLEGASRYLFPEPGISEPAQEPARSDLKPLFSPRSQMALTHDSGITANVTTVWGANSPSSQKDVEREATEEADRHQQQLEQMFQQGLEQGRARLADELQAQAEAEGHQQGFQQGLEQGLAAGQEQITAQLQTLSEISARMDDSARILNSEQVRQAAGLLEHLLMELVAGELHLQPEHIVDLVSNATGLLSNDKDAQVRVYVHPDDIPWLEPRASTISSQLSFIPDATLTPGGCRVESGQGEVFATLESRITEAVEQFRNSVLDRPEQPGKPDFSPLYDAREAYRQKQAGADAPQIAGRAGQPAHSASHSGTKTETADSGFRFEPNAEASAQLGAWGALGQ